jgi:uncharacterized membrane protein/sporulation protein YlmC with PRC-barrel domain
MWRREMRDIPLFAEVKCTDGICGKSFAVIIDPKSKKVTHIIVSGDDFPEGRLVGIEKISASSREMVQIDCSIADLVNSEPFTETRYVKTEVPVDVYYDVYNLPYVTPSATESVEVPIDEELIPPDELALHRGAPVEAKDGYIGEVGEFMVDPNSGKISHMILREGHLWGKKEISLPVSAIDKVDNDIVYLQLDKESIKMLPEIPIQRDYGQIETNDKKHEILASVYDKVEDADNTLEYFDELRKRGILEIKHAAVIVKDEDGDTKVIDRSDVNPKQGTIFGTITGGLIGLIGGPIGVIFGAAAGAATGKVAAGKIDMGFSDKFLNKLKDELQPGKSALIVVVEHRMADDLSEVLSNLEGLHFNQAITDAVINEILAKSSETP